MSSDFFLAELEAERQALAHIEELEAENKALREERNEIKRWLEEDGSGGCLAILRALEVNDE